MKYNKFELLKGEKNRLTSEMRKLVDGANAEDRSLNETELKQFDNLKAEAKSIIGRLEQHHDLLQAEKAGEFRSITGNGGEPTSEWRNAETGEPIKVYKRGQKIAEENAGANLSLGGFCRAMVTGARNAIEERALVKGSGSGSYSVPTEIAKQVIDRLRENLVFNQAGMTTVPLSGPTKMVKITADATAAWHEENASISATDPTLAQVSFDPKWVVGLTKASRELVQQSVNIETAIETSLVGAIANAIETGILRGAGSSGEPLGLDNWTSIQSFALGENGDNLAGYEDIIYSRYLLQNQNADPTAAIMSPRTSRDFALLLDSTNQPLLRPDAIRELQFLTTKNVLDNYTQGSATENTSRIYIGDWSQLYLGILENMRVELLKETFAANFQYGFLAFAAIDVQPLFEQAFCRVDGVKESTLTNTYYTE